MRHRLTVLVATALLVLGGCTMPGAPADEHRLETTAAERRADPAPATANDAATAPAPRKAPPMSDPLPPTPVGEAKASTPPVLDRSCRTSADCAVKNVGNCCGMQPACVNADSPTDPAAVQAQCQREGRMSVCGFKPVQACECVAGSCEDVPMTFEEKAR